VEHRHLLPEEFDLLLDGEVGFGVTPLRAHIRRCADCRAELQAQRAIVAELDELPHFAPSPMFAERVMSQVHVFEPAHVAATDTARRWLPESRPARVFAGALAACVAFFVSAGALWALARLDGVVALSGLVSDRGRVALGHAVSELAAGALGAPAAAAIAATGPSAVLLALTALLVAIVAAALALRALAGAARRRRV
jgi:hypothetical protein